MADTASGSLFRVERSILVEAPPAAIYPLVDDFRRWPGWSPYEGLEFDLKRDYAGAPSGLGAVYAWQGKGKAGAGRMEIVEVAAPNRITIDLRFSKPMRARNKAEFTFVPEGGATRVTWAMEAAKPLVFRIVSLLMDMDKLIGRDFEKGLATLKTMAEGSETPKPSS